MTEPVAPDTGPMSFDDLQAVWESSVDELFSRPLIEKGDGHGIEAYGQAFAQLERASLAVDVATQAMYVLPHSGQTNDPAAGEALATVELTFSRTGRLELPLVLTGDVFVEELTTDWGEQPGDGAQEILTGRRYALVEPVVFPPGVGGPLVGTARAERPGYGYNNPLPGTISSFEQVGEPFENDGASVSASRIVGAPAADVFIPDHVGQYVLLTGGANAGKIARVQGYAAPTPTDGGAVSVARDVAFEGAPTGTMTVGEEVQQAGTGAKGTFLGASATFAVLQVRTGTFNGTGVLTGTVSGATFAPTAIVSDSSLVPEVGTAAWRIFSWRDDWGLTATNDANPTGGRLGSLDELGHERNLPRGPGEADASYRTRVSRIADVVSPNAVRRAVTSVLKPVGLSGCVREAGGALLRGFFYDRLDGLGDAWDLDMTGVSPNPSTFFPGETVTQLDPATGILAVGRAVVGYQGPGAVGPVPTAVLLGVNVQGGSLRAGLPIVGSRSGATTTPATIDSLGLNPADRYRYVFDYVEMRAFFLVALPTVGFGEFGFAYDEGPYGFYDAAPYLAFYDGYPAAAASFYGTVAQAVDRVRAGGVGFTLVRDDGPCS